MNVIDVPTSTIDIMQPRQAYYTLQQKFYYNNPPVLNPIGNQNGLEAHLLQFNISATDADGDHLTFTATNLPLGSQFVDNNNGTATFSWIPAWNQSGIYSDVHFEVNDGHGGIDFENITIIINNWMLAPIPVNY